MISAAKIEVRLANKEDAGLIALLGRVTFSESFGHYFKDNQDLLDYLDLTFPVDKIESGISKSNNVFWIAFVDRLAVGYAKLKLNSTSEFITDINVCQLQKIYVLRDFQSMKIGHMLQELILETARAKGFHEIWLSALKQNVRAIKFYHKNGFHEIGSHNYQIGKESFDFSVLSKILNRTLN